MNTNDLFSKSGPAGKKDLKPTVQNDPANGLLTLADRIWFDQEFDPLEPYASQYFRAFKAETWKKWRYWLMDNETIADLKPEYVNCVLKHKDWFKRQIEELKEHDKLEF